MVAFPLAHVTWSMTDNANRAACDQFFIDVFGAETVYEMLVTPETEHMGFDREERLMVIGDTMLIPIAPAGAGASPDSPLGNMLRRCAGVGRWLGVSLRVADLSEADAWFRARGFQLHYDPGMEAHYFLINRRQALGMRIEVMVGELPNDPRLRDDWNPQRWVTDHPLGIEGLQAIGISASDLASARALFADRLEMPELGERYLVQENADCTAFWMGDTAIEAMVPRDPSSPLAAHLRDIQGIRSLTFKVCDAAAAAGWLEQRGLELIGDVADRFAIVPEQAQGRLIWFTGHPVAAYPAMGSAMRRPPLLPS
jgi:hypothetical protein